MLGAEQIVAEIAQSPVGKVKLGVTDIDGVLRGKYIHKDKFAGALSSGLGFCSVIFGWDCNDVVYDHGQYSGWHAGYPDAQAHIDLRTYRKVPWDRDVPFFLADFSDAAGKPLPVCPRQLLRRVLKRAESMGFEPMVGVELEWFNFRETPQSLRSKKFLNLEPLTPGMFGYSILRAGQNSDFINALFDELRAFGVPLEALHTETGPGVLEAALLYCEALEAADRAALFKTSVKEIAARHGITASFMAKWHPELPGCGGHVHQSLLNAHGTNVFFDGRNPAQMSAVFRHYVAGQLACLPALLPLFLPNINSYKRLREGLWAPTRLSWGTDDRTAALRVIAGSAKTTRLETRVSGADMNPYLVLAACIAGGLYGIEHKLELVDESAQGHTVGGAAALLPTNLGTAAQQMADSTLARELLGAEFVDHFSRSRLWEWRQFQQAVTSWELERYFEVI